MCHRCRADPVTTVETVGSRGPRGRLARAVRPRRRLPAAGGDARRAAGAAGVGGPGRRGEREAMPSGAIGATDPRVRRAALPSPALAAGAQPCAQEGPRARLWRPSGACPVEQKGGAWCDPQIRHAGNSPRRLSESGAKRGARPPKQSPDRGFFPPTENHLPVTGRGSPAEPGTERCSDTMPPRGWLPERACPESNSGSYCPAARP